MRRATAFGSTVLLALALSLARRRCAPSYPARPPAAAATATADQWVVAAAASRRRPGDVRRPTPHAGTRRARRPGQAGDRARDPTKLVTMVRSTLSS
jgi:hypothetical protein